MAKSIKVWHCSKCHFMDCSDSPKRFIDDKHVSHRGVDIGTCGTPLDEYIPRSRTTNKIKELEKEGETTITNPITGKKTKVKNLLEHGAFLRVQIQVLKEVLVGK